MVVMGVASGGRGCWGKGRHYDGLDVASLGGGDTATHIHLGRFVVESLSSQVVIHCHFK